ncbi:MAG: UvrD-helicase domain-containing protein [Chloroflexota bacterium]
MDLFHELNSAQQEAVAAIEGPVLVLAGPGSGKTRVLTHRVGHLIQDHDIAPWRILAVTFTNKAAKEMQERLVTQEILSESQLHSLTAGTFHGICARILRQDIEHLGIYSRDFVIFDSGDQQKIVKDILVAENINTERNPPRAVHSGISKAKNDLFTPDKFRPATYREEIIKRVYERYQAALEANNALDFDDLIMKTHQLLNECPEVLQKYQDRYRHVMVDEFQDTNEAQYNLVQQFAGGHRNLFVVGDEDQSIYSWRGADYRNVLRFQKDYPEAKVILLEQNYRSTQTILEAATSIIDRNQHRHAKTLFTDRDHGQQIVRIETYDGFDEARFVVKEIQRVADFRGISTADFAVMYRTNAQSRVIEEAFVQSGMPYRLVRGTRFYERREVKDALAYLRLIHNPHDTLSLARIINVPARSIGKKTLERLDSWAIEQDFSVWQALVHLHNLETDEAEISQVRLKKAHPFAKRAAKSLIGFTKIMQLLIAAKEKMNLTTLIDLTLARSGYRDFLQDGTDEGEERWENLQELKTVAKQYDSLSGEEALALFLEEVALISDVDELTDTEQGPALLTLHTAKGLEFPIVFMVGMEDGIFPHSRSREDPEQMEEERRLAYVGVTRAKDQLYLTHAFRRTIFGQEEIAQPSPFLADIPLELVDVRSSQNKRGSSTRTWERQSARQHRTYQRQTQWDTGNRYERRRPGQSKDINDESSFKAGDRVIHDSFGEGTVIQSKVDGADELVTVAFPGKGIKQLIADFAGLEKIG